MRKESAYRKGFLHSIHHKAVSINCFSSIAKHGQAYDDTNLMNTLAAFEVNLELLLVRNKRRKNIGCILSLSNNNI